jgi:hypothetical protein
MEAWERAHHLSLRVDQSQRDQDHDGLRNRSEYRSHTDPHRRDSDRDGVPDGREDGRRRALRARHDDRVVRRWRPACPPAERRGRVSVTGPAIAGCETQRLWMS